MMFWKAAFLSGHLAEMPNPEPWIMPTGLPLFDGTTATPTSSSMPWRMVE